MFYVYEHICVATGQCFYVGKGKNNRAYSKHRIAVSIAKKGKKQTEAHKKATSIAIAKWWADRKAKKESSNEMA